MANGDCLFCRIVSGEIPAKVVYQDTDTLAFRDVNPQAPTHVLVVPRRHLASVDAASAGDAELIGKIFLAAADVARQEGIATSGYRLVINNGPDAQQSVPHIHVHVIGGRAMSWPPG